MTLQYINHPVSNWPVRQYFPDPEVISWKALRPSWSLARRLSRIHFKAAKKFQSSLMRAWKRLKKPARALCFVLLALCPFDSFWNWSLQALHAPSVQLLSELPKPAPVPKMLAVWTCRSLAGPMPKVGGPSKQPSARHELHCYTKTQQILRFFLDGMHYSLSIWWFDESKSLPLSF